MSGSTAVGGFGCARGRVCWASFGDGSALTATTVGLADLGQFACVLANKAPNAAAATMNAAANREITRTKPILRTTTTETKPGPAYSPTRNGIRRE